MDDISAQRSALLTRKEEARFSIVWKKIPEYYCTWTLLSRTFGGNEKSQAQSAK